LPVPGGPTSRRNRDRLLHVQQRAGDRVDRLAVQLGRVDDLAVGELDRLADGIDVEVDLAGRRGAVEVAVGADVVDLPPGGSDRRGHACLLVRVFAMSKPGGRRNGADRCGVVCDVLAPTAEGVRCEYGGDLYGRAAVGASQRPR
jgi:hypothetical protein